ncbi:CAM1 (YPL048W) [Zygosaccharomyces parabailii]|nr:CAM1 (YPL048W) [Zygosaccharomyces parabailii]CDH08824.1 probable Elongation factor 1-gamma 1 [Zygosaccharomyces bailii ISA1307]
MSEGLLYSNFRIRSLVPRALVKTLKLDVDVVDPYTVEEQFAKDFPLKKLPSFKGPNGFKLTEQMAINYYLIRSSSDEKLKEQLLGTEDDIKTQSQIIRWESLANSDLITALAKVFVPLKGDAPYIKKNVDEASKFLEEIASIYEERLREYTYLAGENLTLADLVSAAMFIRGFNFLFGTEWRKSHPAIVRWFKTVIASPFLKAETADFKFIEKPLEPPQGKKKESKKEQPKKKEAPAAAPAPPAEKKPKHPLELLGKSSFTLDEWKRKYSNEDTRPVALPWFWEHYNPEEWSLWKVAYKYNDELTLTFMSNNLIGGFFARLAASIKYMFGCMVVYGENNNNGIIGAVLIRGQDHTKAFDVAPDWESYEFTKLDASKPEDKAFVEDMWAWDKPVIINGESKEIVDGKVLK